MPASAMERENATGMLAIWPGRQMSRNHSSDTPTIGNVTPPFGPWKDSV